MTQWAKNEIELALIREFSTRDQTITQGLSLSDKHERVRVAIMREGRSALTFHDSGLSYAQIFRVWSGKSCEMRGRYQPPPAEEHDDDPDDSD